jgi:acyl-ACP thioesterase
MYRFQTRVRYSEVAENGQTSISSIVNYFQDCSTMQSESLGQGIETLIQRKRGWFLTSWQIHIKKYPKLGDEIIVGTLPHSFKGLYGERNFVIYDCYNNVLAIANTLWAFIDLETGHPTKITKEDSEMYVLEDKLDMEYLPRKIKLPETLVKQEQFEVKKYHVDTNHHVNNAKYIQMAEEYVPEGVTIKQLRVEYKRSAKYNDMIVSKLGMEEKKYIVELCDVDDTVYATIEFVAE